MSAGNDAIAASAISAARALKSGVAETKSVSQPRHTITPFVPWMRTRTAPSEVSRSARLAATSLPFSRMMLTAFSKSPSASARAFLQSIIPADVILRNFITSCAVIAITRSLLIIQPLVPQQPEPQPQERPQPLRQPASRFCGRGASCL